MINLKPNQLKVLRFPLALMATLWVGIASAHAGVFTLPNYVEPGVVGLGLEPELVLSNGSGVGANARLQLGMNELSNLHAYVGGGSGPRGFRIGAIYNFDIFPDVNDQPGVGLGFQAGHVTVVAGGQFQTRVIPYISKTFRTGAGALTPFFAVPLGLAFTSGSYQSVSSVNFGTAIKSTPNFRYVLEVAIGLANDDSSISGGVMFYP